MFNRDASAPMVTNCTFTGNSAGSGGGMYNDYSEPTVTNCILWGDLPDDVFNFVFLPVITYSLVQGGYGGAGNIDGDPVFVDVTASDYHLQKGSPCIDAGTNEGAPIGDLDGNPRPIDADGDARNITDMGAYEFVVTWVDFGFVGSEDGSFDHPFDTLGEALDVAPASTMVRIKGDTADSDSDETMTIDQVVTIEAVNGTVRIGDIGGRSSDNGRQTGLVSRVND